MTHLGILPVETNRQTLSPMGRKRFKVVLLGEGRVGKTSLLVRYVHGTFQERIQSTVQAHFLEKSLTLGSTSVLLNIWDTAGQERFHALAPIYYRDADGAVLVYDITDSTSFERVKHWVKELTNFVGPNITLVIAANKADLSKQQVVTDAVAESYAKSVGASIFKTSAKSGKGVEESFLELTKGLLRKSPSKKKKKAVIIDDDESIQDTRKKSCC